MEHFLRRKIGTQVQQASHGRYGSGGSVLFHAASIAATAGVADRRVCGVADFGRHPQVAAQNLAFDNDAAADTSAQGQQDEIVDVTPSADPFFAQRCCVGVVL